MPDSASETAQTPRDRFRKLIVSFESYVRAEKEKGVEAVPATPALVAALANPIPPPPPSRKSRIQNQPGRRHPHPDLVFLWAPPDEEAATPSPAAKETARQLLAKMIEAMGYTCDDVVIADLADRQMAELKPKIIIALGTAALQHLMGPNAAPLAQTRGQWLTYKGVDVMPTFHPSDLLRAPASKKEAWTDLKAVLAKLGRKPPMKK